MGIVRMVGGVIYVALCLISVAMIWTTDTLLMTWLWLFGH